MNSMLYMRPKRNFESSQFYFDLLRLTDEEYKAFRERSFPIQYQNMLSWSLVSRDQEAENSFNLAKLLVLLEEEFGRSSSSYDPWRQGFCFPFLLKIQKAIGPLHYLLNISDYKGSIDFNLYKIIDNVKYIDKEPDIYQQPITEELSEKEINQIVGYIWGFYEGYAESYLNRNPHVTPFFKYIACSNLIYGYWDDQFQEKTFEDDEDCRLLAETLDHKYGESSKSPEDKICRTQEMILNITTP